MDVDDPGLPAQVAGAAEAGHLRAALELRKDVLAMTAKSRRSVLVPAEPGGLSHALRLGLAVRMARQNGDAALAAAYAGLGAADATVADPASGPSEPRLAALVRHADLVATRPKDATPDDVAKLTAAGIAEADIVRLSQLVAFVAYEARLVAGLRLLAKHGAGA